MRPGTFQRRLLSLLTALTAAAIAAAGADAAEPTVYQLPDATHASSLAPGADGSVWFAPSRGPEWAGPKGRMVGIVRADGKVGELAIPGFGHPVSGTAGEAWVSGEREDAAGGLVPLVGRLTADGQLENQHAVGRGGTRIGEMAIARGAVWFVRRSAGRRETIARLSIADGAVRKFVLGKACEVRAIAAAENGALWFTETCRRHPPNRESTEPWSAIGRIDLGGRIARHRLGAKGIPLSIAVGQNGTVWFGITHNGFSADLVGRITKAGALAEYRIRGYPDSIAVGPGGRVWFASWLGRRHPALGSITQSGERELACADPTCELEPTALATAPDGSLWYGLARPNLNEGGGGSGIAINMEIENEPGFVAHLPEPAS